MGVYANVCIAYLGVVRQFGKNEEKKMVDIEGRKKLAYHLRHLSIGLISNDEFEDYITDDVSFGWLPEQYYRSKEAKFDDGIIQPILELSWCLL